MTPARIRAAFLPALLSALLAVGGCVANPVTGKKELVLISTETEIETGREHYLPAQQAEGGRYTADAVLGEYVTFVGERMAAVSDRALPYQFVVLNNSTPNAWALPGGKIAVNRGLLVELDNEAELAAVLGHEVVHAAARHGARAMQRDILFSTIQLGVALASEDSKNADYAVGAAQLALGLTNLKYGRDAERDSDYYGMKYMHAAGYDTASAVTLQEKFVALSKSRKDNWISGLFASHPPSAERVADNRRALATFPGGGMVGRARYREHLAHLLSRKDAYEQADRARELLDSDPRAALQTINAAIQKEPREQLFHGIKGHALAYQEHYQEALRAYDTAIQYDPHPGYYEHFLGRGLAYKNLGQNTRAQADLERSNQLLPNVLANFHLGHIAAKKGDRENAKKYFLTAGDAGGEIGESAHRIFTMLDIADAPWRYVDAEILFGEDELFIEVHNKTPYPLQHISLGVNADINGRTHRRKPSLARLAPNAKKKISGGVRYREEDEVEVGVEILGAKIAN
ncbi:M48 family metalloprotease [Candidatus Spongiihabitans sp.]|uniref:M48 family metalloprotease n=1 Tax=Candidatus Spongiihabitans sp. TaxID=3101308 RepID=UPI003C6ECE0D